MTKQTTIFVIGSLRVKSISLASQVLGQQIIEKKKKWGFSLILCSYYNIFAYNTDKVCKFFLPI